MSPRAHRGPGSPGVRHGWRAWFAEQRPADADEVASELWTSGVGADAYEGRPAYQAAIMEQYRLYVEMADRVSARRGFANTFFLTLNSSALVLFGVFWKDPPTGTSAWLAVLPLVALLGQCGAWFWTLRSYRQLNSGKWAVVGALERRLPASPWWRAEWTALGRGEDPSRYWPLTHLEQWVPALFAAVYLAGFVALLLTS